MHNQRRSIAPRVFSTLEAQTDLQFIPQISLKSANPSLWVNDLGICSRRVDWIFGKERILWHLHSWWHIINRSTKACHSVFLFAHEIKHLEDYSVPRISIVLACKPSLQELIPATCTVSRAAKGHRTPNYIKSFSKDCKDLWLVCVNIWWSIVNLQRSHVCWSHYRLEQGPWLKRPPWKKWTNANKFAMLRYTW